MAAQPQLLRPALSERVSRYREQLLEASQSLGLDPNGEGRPAELGFMSRRLSGGGSPCCPEHGRQSPDLQKLQWLMKRLKLATTEAEYMHAVSEGCMNGVICENANNSLEPRRQEMKRQTKALKEEFRLQHEACQKATNDWKQALLAAETSHSECLHALQVLADDHHHLSVGGLGKEAEVGSTWASGPHRQASDAVDQSLSEVLRLAQRASEERRMRGTVASTHEHRSLHEQRSEVRREEERLEQELHQLQVQEASVLRGEQETNKHIAAYEKLNEAEEALGFSAVHFDDARGLIVLGNNHGAMITCAGQTFREVDLLTVAAQPDKEGRLIRAEAHPVLDLKNAAQVAVDRDDLPFLLTQVWHKVRELECVALDSARRRSSLKGNHRRSSNGGA